MTEAHHRHDLSDQTWSLLEPHLPGRRGRWGGVARDNRRFLDAVLWILRTGAPWRDLPPDYGDWKNTHRRFCRWRDKGIWESLLEQLMDEPDYEWLMIGGNQEMGRTRRGSTRNCIWPWMRMVCRSERLQQQVPRRIAARLTS